MPETRFLAQHQPRPTSLPRAQLAQQPGGGATAGSHVSASPGAGGFGQSQVYNARAALSTPPGVIRPPGTRPQDARVQVVPRQGAAPHAGAQAGGGGVGLASNARPTVQIIPRVASGPAQTQVPPGGGVPLNLDESMLVGQLLHKYIESCVEGGDRANAELASNALGKVSTSVQILMEMMAQVQAAQAQQAAPAPTRVQVPSHPTAPAHPGSVGATPAWQPSHSTAPVAQSWPPPGFQAVTQLTQPGPAQGVPAAWAGAQDQPPATLGIYPWPNRPQAAQAQATPAAQAQSADVPAAAPIPATAESQGPHGAA